jgi:D-cysteine desulfhydrase
VTGAAPLRSLALLPTPLQRVPALEDALGAGPVYLKRDDLTGFGLAGNKARPLEYLLGSAVAQHCDVLVTAGAPGSNFTAAAALAARVTGLDCHLLVAGDEPRRWPVTLELARRCDAQVRFTGAEREALDGLVDRHAGRLAAQGRRPYAVPRGGATPVGGLGFAAAATELAEQLGPLRHDDVTVVLPTGSGASLAGFLAGRAALGATGRTYGVSVSRPPAELRRHVLDLAAGCADLLGVKHPAAEDLHLLDATGTGFGLVTDRDRAAAGLALAAAGVLLDPTYGAKAFAAVQDLVGQGHDGPLVLWQTGGTPGALSLLAGPDGVR